MSENKKSNKNVGAIVASITMAASLLSNAKPAIDAVRDYANKTIEERKKLVIVPELYSKEYPLTIEQAVELLNNCGLKATLVKTTISDANIKYRSCFDTQVIKSYPKSKQKVERGTSILVKYISQEVINESQRLYELAEKEKSEQQATKILKQTEWKEKSKRVATDVIEATIRGIQKMSFVKKKADIDETIPDTDKQN